MAGSLGPVGADDVVLPLGDVRAEAVLASPSLVGLVWWFPFDGSAGAADALYALADGYAV